MNLFSAMNEAFNAVLTWLGLALKGLSDLIGISEEKVIIWCVVFIASLFGVGIYKKRRR